MKKCKTCKGTGDLVPERTKRGSTTGKYLPATKDNIKKHVIGGGCICCCSECDGLGKIKRRIDDSEIFAGTGYEFCSRSSAVEMNYGEGWKPIKRIKRKFIWVMYRKPKHHYCPVCNGNVNFPSEIECCGVRAIVSK